VALRNDRRAGPPAWRIGDRTTVAWPPDAAVVLERT